MLKTTNFESLHLLKRFVLYFIHEFYVFEGSDITYYKCKPTEDDNSVIKAYDPKNFFKVQIQFIENKKPRSTKLSDLLNTIPFHKFANTVCKWEHDPNDMETFSLANPPLAKDFHEEITESDLHPVLLDYLKRIICFNHPKRYQFLVDGVYRRKRYHEEEVNGNITEFIGASNNLIGIVEDKMTTFDVNPAGQHNKVYYGELIDDVIKNENEINKFYTYLKQFANPKPKSFFRTPIYDSMTTASNEGITNYVNKLKESGLNGIVHTESQGQYRVERDIIYQHYQRWCETADEVPDKRSKFCEKPRSWTSISHSSDTKKMEPLLMDSSFTVRKVLSKQNKAEKLDNELTPEEEKKYISYEELMSVPQKVKKIIMDTYGEVFLSNNELVHYPLRLLLHSTFASNTSYNKIANRSTAPEVGEEAPDFSYEPAPQPPSPAEPLTRSKARRERIFHGDFTPTGSDKSLEIEIFEK
ncbi:unnamed protein product [Phytophthora lilii]|uniref:Unnamed protein product n=1 Tax=Phytophthora lilii TaxID=2077276 RepID=A0A9W6U0J5_9STRA|nr:unnamed protein product [Phytophthora lilii]